MIALSADAQKELDAYFADKEKQSVRIHFTSGG